MGFEEAGFLLLFGWLPTQQAAAGNFHDVLAQASYELPTHFMETNILLTPSSHLMNRLQQMVLALFDYDASARRHLCTANILRQGHGPDGPYAGTHYFTVPGEAASRATASSLTIHYPQEPLSIAENILYLLREDHHHTVRRRHRRSMCC